VTIVSVYTDPSSGGGTKGPQINAGSTVQVSCYVIGLPVANGNRYWYRIASAPWNNAFYTSADPYYNNGATSGPLKGTPYVDPAVPAC
jgi:hypothetical protein